MLSPAVKLWFRAAVKYRSIIYLAVVFSSQFVPVIHKPLQGLLGVRDGIVRDTLLNTNSRLMLFLLSA